MPKRPLVSPSAFFSYWPAMCCVYRLQLCVEPANKPNPESPTAVINIITESTVELNEEPELSSRTVRKLDLCTVPFDPYSFVPFQIHWFIDGMPVFLGDVYSRILSNCLWRMVYVHVCCSGQVADERLQTGGRHAEAREDRPHAPGEDRERRPQEQEGRH